MGNSKKRTCPSLAQPPRPARFGVSPGGNAMPFEEAPGEMKSLSAQPPVKRYSPLIWEPAKSPHPHLLRQASQPPSPLPPAPRLVGTRCLVQKLGGGGEEPERAASFLGQAVGPYPLRSYSTITNGSQATMGLISPESCLGWTRVPRSLIGHRRRCVLLPTRSGPGAGKHFQ